jgi:hypothetical protein
LPVKLSLKQDAHDIGHLGIVDRTLDLDPPMKSRRNLNREALHLLHVNTPPYQNIAGIIEMLKADFRQDGRARFYLLKLLILFVIFSKIS